MSKVVSVVIPNHNGLKFLRRCLPALRRSELPKGWELQTIVVDNGSKDDSPDFLRTQSDVTALVFEEGLGFSGANNAAREVARGDVVVFLNNDTEVEPRWLLRPLELLSSDEQVGATSSKLLFMHPFVKVVFELPRNTRAFVCRRIFGNGLDEKVRWSPGVSPECGNQNIAGRWVANGDAVYLPVPIADLDPAVNQPVCMRILELQGVSGDPLLRVVAGGKRLNEMRRLPGIFVMPPLESLKTVRLIQNAGSFISPEAGDGGDVGTGAEDGGGGYDREEIVPSLCGAALFVRRDVLDAVGWFPDYYRVYYEDTDMCLRMRKLGKHLVYCPESRVLHFHTGTNREWSPFFVENVTRSSLLFSLRHGHSTHVRRRLKGMGETMLRSALHAIRKRQDPRKLIDENASLRGYVRALKHIPPVVLQRVTDRHREQQDAPLFTASRKLYEGRS